MTQLISVVDTHKLPQGLLSDLHLQSSKKYIDPENYPTYENVEKGLLFVERRLVDMDEIVGDEVFLGTQGHGGQQIVRTSVAGNIDATRHSIVENGLKLTCLPISLVLLNNKKFGFLDGRTRHGIFKNNCKLKNVIADVYKYDLDYTPEEQQLAGQRFAMRANFDEAPGSPFTMEEIVRHTFNAVHNGWISKNGIRKEILLVNDNQFSLLKVNKMVLQTENEIAQHKAGVPLCNTYDERSASNWLAYDAKIQSNQNNNGIYYLTVSSSFGTKFIPWVARKYQELLQDIAVNNKTKCKQLRVIVYVGTLASSDLEASWKIGIDRFRNKVEKLMSYVCKTWFVDTPDIANKVVLYGAIPAVYGLSEDYPMDKIVRFKQDLNDQTFDEIDTPKTLDDYLDID